uniref:DbpA RNA binding domain-containing protein n=1 Tax=Microbacterium sp. CPCC 204701 TaxID=2493084 RepID=UPI00197B8777
PRERRERTDRDRGDRPDRPERGERPERRAPREGLATYRIAVGKRHRVEPRQIVGALANEGGLRRDDFGAIQIMPAFSLVELPANLSRETLDRLSDTRISGQLIELRPDSGRPQRRTDGERKPYRDDRGPHRPSVRDGGDRKPRYKRGEG